MALNPIYERRGVNGRGGEPRKIGGGRKERQGQEVGELRRWESFITVVKNTFKKRNPKCYLTYNWLVLKLLANSKIGNPFMMAMSYVTKCCHSKLLKDVSKKSKGRLKTKEK